MNKPSPLRYSLGMLGLTIPTQAFATFLFFFYSDTMGLAIGLAAVARIVYSIYDALCNPLFGYLSDRTRTRWGRRRPWLVASLPFYLIAFVLIFWVPAPLRSGTLLFWYFLAAVILHDSLSTILWDNYAALFPELFPGLQERTRVNTLRQALQVVGLIIGAALTPIAYSKLGFAGMALLYAALAGVLVGLSLWGNRESPEVSHVTPMAPVAAFRTTLTNRGFWSFAVANALTKLAFGILTTGMPFYAKYSLGLNALQTTIMFGAVFLVAIPMVSLWAWAVRRFGGKRAWLAAVSTLAISALPLFVASGLLGGILAGAVVGLGFSGVVMLEDIMIADVIDDDAARTGERREGAYFSVHGFIVRLGGLLVAAAITVSGALYGYSSGDHPGPNPGGAFRFLMTVVPCVAVALAVLVGRTYPRNLRSEERVELRHSAD